MLWVCYTCTNVTSTSIGDNHRFRWSSKLHMECGDETQHLATKRAYHFDRFVAGPNFQRIIPRNPWDERYIYLHWSHKHQPNVNIHGLYGGDVCLLSISIIFRQWFYIQLECSAKSTTSTGRVGLVPPAASVVFWDHARTNRKLRNA